MLENDLKSLPILDNTAKESSDQTLLLFLEFQEWMRTQRGTLNSTLNGYRLPIISLLKNLGTDSSLFTAKTLREFLIREMASFSQEKSKNWGTAIRMFLRFLIAKGRCQSGLEYAIPTIARWRLSSMPKYLAAEDVEKLEEGGDCEDLQPQPYSFLIDEKCSYFPHYVLYLFGLNLP